MDVESAFGVFRSSAANKNLHSLIKRSVKAGIAGSSGKRGQLHQVVPRHRLDGLACLPPGRKTADDHKRIKPLFPQQVRHPGAGRFSQSSAIQVDVAVARQVLDLLGKIIGFDPYGTLDTTRVGIIVAVAADIGDERHSLVFFLQAAG